MSDPSPMIKAKRGDLVIIVQEHHDYIIGKGTQESTTCEISIVSSVSREGVIKAFKPARYSNEPSAGDTVPLKWLANVTSTPFIPASRINIAAALKAARDHQWPGGQPYMPFDSLDEVRTALKPCLVGAQAPAVKAGS